MADDTLPPDGESAVNLGGCLWVRQGGEWHSYIHGRVASTDGRAYEFHEALDSIWQLEQELAALRALARDVESVEQWAKAVYSDRCVEYRDFEGPAKCWQASYGYNIGPQVWPYVTAPTLPELGARLRAAALAKETTT